MFIVFVKYLMAANVCSVGWHESLGMMMSEVVSFLYMSKDILSVAFIIEMSRKFNLFPFSCSSMKVRLGDISLNDLRT